jgi:hypothetical protein
VKVSTELWCKPSKRRILILSLSSENLVISSSLQPTGEVNGQTISKKIGEKF